jgi:hypothetical protein
MKKIEEEFKKEMKRRATQYTDGTSILVDLLWFVALAIVGGTLAILIMAITK